ncbi:MAG TPA: hypothetical protein VGI39_23835, partial [Polyangiaceae bacterium]
MQTFPAAHACPHPPQFAMLIDVSMHAPPQDVVPGAQTQALAEQTWFVPQALPQAPQFAALVERSVH